MASPDNSAKMLSQPETPNPTSGFQQEAMKPGVTISLLEIGSLSPLFWGSCFSLGHKGHQTPAPPQMTQKFRNLFRDIKEILKSVAGAEEKTREEDESFEEDSSDSEAVSELKLNIKGPDKTNKMLSKNLLVHSDPDKEWDTKRQEMILKTQKRHNSKNTVQASARYTGIPCDRRSLSETQLGPDRKRRYTSLYGQEENRRLRNNMEELLLEADHWSQEHSELSQLIKSYQKSQKEKRETLENHLRPFPSQPNKEASTRQELEAQVRKLNHDTFALHLIAALLENECKILQQRVEILREFHHYQEKPRQVNYDQYKKSQKPGEADKVETNKNMRVIEGTCHKRDKVYRNSDACLRKKARNNKFNTRIARRALIGKKRTTSGLR